jgi:predicted naringenin-chalcone synthase
LKNKYLKNFQSLTPPFSQDQSTTLDWIAFMHAKSEKILSPEIDEETFYLKLKTLLSKIGLGPGKIEKRHMFFDDFFLKNEGKKAIYDLESSSKGQCIGTRTRLYNEKMQEALNELYQINAFAPDHIIHTSCTGYSSPSVVQKLVSNKGWGETTQVTHAYHMGCYASIPSIRLASSLLDHSSYIDIVHTEFCTLHMNPHIHSIAQLVIESLFADGVIKYTLSDDLKKDERAFEVLSTYEMIIPDSLSDMSWDVSSYGFSMTLSKDVPQKIQSHLTAFIQKLFKKAEVSLSDNDCIFYAIHPGGPKIIEQVASMLNIPDEKIAFSFDVLKERGNMSSATLPHVWEKMLTSDRVTPNSYIISLAFGPGLTIAGSLFKKIAV